MAESRSVCESFSKGMFVLQRAGQQPYTYKYGDKTYALHTRRVGFMEAVAVCDSAPGLNISSSAGSMLSASELLVHLASIAAADATLEQV